MFNFNIKRLGFACMISDEKGIQDVKYKIGTLTQKKMFTLSESIQYEKLTNKVKENIVALNNQIFFVSSLPIEDRMFRISSSLLPMYDHPTLYKLYDESLLFFLKKELSRIGMFAKEKDIRLSMHPDQFCVLNSENIEVIKKSIICMEKHADIVDMLGFGIEFQDFKVNIHLNGRTDILPMEDMSETIKKCMTLENDEKKGTINRVLEVCQKYELAMVFDIHHHWCNTEGEYLSWENDIIKDIRNTWKGVRPTMHLSQSIERLWSKNNELPNMKEIVKEHKRGKTFAHSQFIDNIKLVEYMLPYNELFDIMIEAKMKNQAVKKFKEIKKTLNKK
jgi:UV damage endonuclease UvdE